MPTPAYFDSEVGAKVAELWGEHCQRRGKLALSIPEKDRAGWERCAQTILDFRADVEATRARYAALDHDPATVQQGGAGPGDRYLHATGDSRA